MRTKVFFALALRAAATKNPLSCRNQTEVLSAAEIHKPDAIRDNAAPAGRKVSHARKRHYRCRCRACIVSFHAEREREGAHKTTQRIKAQGR
ncbi:hypothetical protein BKA80DRAFT_22659 [Phyllosticta citrichinensis]